MINVKEQILYWEYGSGEELLNAKIMLNNQRLIASLFFCHLCLEKILKAHVVKTTRDTPPKTHNLAWLATLAVINVDESQKKFISNIQGFHTEGRYPETFPIEPEPMKALEYFEQTKTLHEWLRGML